MPGRRSDAYGRSHDHDYGHPSRRSSTGKTQEYYPSSHSTSRGRYSASSKPEYDYHDRGRGSHDRAPRHSHRPRGEGRAYDSRDRNREYTRDRDHDRHRARSLPPHRSQENTHADKQRSQGPLGLGNQQIVQVATAALVSGLSEAVRSRHRPDQAKRAIRAAVGAAAVNALVGREKQGNGAQGLTKSALGGMLINRLAGGKLKF